MYKNQISSLEQKIKEIEESHKNNIVELTNEGKNKNMSRTQLIVVTNEILNKKKIFNSLGKKFKQSYTLKKYYMDNLKNK